MADLLSVRWHLLQRSEAPKSLHSHSRYSLGTVHPVDDGVGTDNGSELPRQLSFGSRSVAGLAEVNSGVYRVMGVVAS